MQTIFVGDVGTKLKFDIGTSVSGITSCVIKYKKPDDTIGEWTATTEPDVYIYYITLVDDIDQAGLWKFRVYVVYPDWLGYGTEVSIMVKDSAL